jgi:hypothetical protein
MAGATKLIATAIAKPLSTIVSKAMQDSSTGARSGFYEPKLRSRIGIGAFVADQFGRGDIERHHQGQREFGAVAAAAQPEDRLIAMTTNSTRTMGKCSNGGGISSFPFGPSFGAFIFALVALLAAARSNLAVAEDRGAISIRARTACMVGHQFEPGPIVGGHNRQPTVREFQARIAQLRELEQRDADRCAGTPANVDRCTGGSARTGTC